LQMRRLRLLTLTWHIVRARGHSPAAFLQLEIH
jgi:hypothetical protein